MSWILLVFGIALWWAAHLFKRMAPTRRAALGDAGKGAVTVVLVGAIVLMVIGYRGAASVPIWQPPTFFVHINNLGMLVAIYLMSPAPKRGKMVSGMRHPMLTGFGIWAAAHLLANGDLASLLLFGGLLAWAVATARVINIVEPSWQRSTGGTLVKDAMFFVGSAILLVVIGAVHAWLGVWPFPG